MLLYFVTGAVISHANIHAQISSLVEAWGWTEKDIVLHTLPLHHIHGIVNVLMCPLAVGGRYSHIMQIHVNRCGHAIKVQCNGTSCNKKFFF
jgi:acyl-CoA synthetase (AMP-forming)/AMP-acid ligase II